MVVAPSMRNSYGCVFFFFNLVFYTHNRMSQGFFSKFLMGGGTQNFRSPTGTKSDGGDLRKKISLKPKLGKSILQVPDTGT